MFLDWWLVVVVEGSIARQIRRVVVVTYVAMLVLVPLALILRRTFADGASTVWDALSAPSMVHAMQVTFMISAISVVANTTFGVGLALLLVRHPFPGRRIIDVVVDLPIAVSPVVVGLALILVYGRHGWLGGTLEAHGIQVIFSWPGMVLATTFVSLPFVVRAVAPVLVEIGTSQEEAARTLGAGPWQTFRLITLPAIRGALAYGVALATTRSLGEYGAVAVVSGRLVGKTQTVTLVVEQSFQDFDTTTAYAAALLLSAVSVVCLVIINVLRPRTEGAR